MMIQKIKKLLEIYKRERYFENVQDVQNPKIGISPKEKKTFNGIFYISAGNCKGV